MAQIAATSWACFARFTYSAVAYAVATDDRYRSGTWHDPVLQRDMDLQQQFSTGVTQGRALNLVIADNAGGTYRTLVAGNVLDGTAVTVETVCTLTWDDGTSTEQATTQILTVQGTSEEPGTVTLSLVDLEDDKLNTLYPAHQYTADAFRDIDGGFAGRAIPYPVGTCRKFECPQLFADTVRVQWFHTVCDASGYLTLTIAAINTGAKTFSVAGDYTDRISAGTIVFSNVASANAGKFTVVSAVYSAPNTVITVSETIGSGTVSGALVIPPTVLAVYRDGRLVDSSEYTVELAHPATGQIDDSDFDNSPVTWAATSVGTGTASLTGGRGRLTGDGGASNYGTLTTAGTTHTTLPRSYLLATITLATGNAVRMYGQTLTAGVVITSAGTHTVPVLQSQAAGYVRANVTNINTTYSGTVEVDDLTLNTTHTLLMLRFVREQVGFDGRPYSITADVRGVASRNAAVEISRLLTAAGCTPDSTSFTAAQTYADTHVMLVDVDHGFAGNSDGGAGQRRVRTLLDDLLFIARASLSRNSAGHYVITQDKAASTAATLDEDAGDAIAVQQRDRPPRPVSVAIRFAPNPRDPGTLAYTTPARTITGGVLAADAPREVRYLTDATAADHLVCYLALRAQYNRRLRFRQMQAQRVLGDVVNITSANTYPGAADWFVDDVQQRPGGVDCAAREYNSAVHTYSAGTLPNGATTAYQPDYSQTPPVAPTAMSITAGSVATALDGTMVARVTVKATPPSVNWSELWFAIIHNTTGEIAALIRGESLGAGEYGSTATSIRPGEVYKLQCYAVNAFNVSGAVLSSFNATAIGGGNPVTTFTSTGQTTLPGNVSSCSRSQSTGRGVRVYWPAVSGAAIWGYILERKTGAGAYSEIWRGQGTERHDTDVGIGVNYTWRVLARDTYGNVSASYATSSSLTLTSNVTGGNGGGDLSNTTVETANRTALTGVAFTYTATEAAFMAANGLVNVTVTHGLGKVPAISGLVTTAANVIVQAQNPTTTQIDILALGFYSTTPRAEVSNTNFSAAYVEAELDGHRHPIALTSVVNGDTATVYCW